jgi:hypothetical protein
VLTERCAPVPVKVRAELTTSSRRRSKLIRSIDPNAFADEEISMTPTAALRETTMTDVRRQPLSHASSTERYRSRVGLECTIPETKCSLQRNAVMSELGCRSWMIFGLLSL